MDSSIESNAHVRSAIVNCICPECGGAIELHSNQLRCLGRCGKIGDLSGRANTATVPKHRDATIIGNFAIAGDDCSYKDGARSNAKSPHRDRTLFRVWVTCCRFANCIANPSSTR